MNPITEDHVRSVFHIAHIPVLGAWELAHSYFAFNPEESEEVTLTNARYRATRPSWLVKTPYGLIALNLRKRVVDIDWKDTGYHALDVGEGHPITSDEVSKDTTYVHAYTLIKASEYLTKLKQCLDQPSRWPDIPRVHLNDVVEVTLTEVGAQVIRGQYAKLARGVGTEADKAQWAQNAEQFVAGYVWRTQLHDVMYTLGPACRLGLSTPISSLSPVLPA